MIDASLVLDDITNFSKDIKPRYRQLVETFNTLNINTVELGGRALKEWDRRVKDVTPFYMKNLKVFSERTFFVNKRRFKKLRDPIKLVKFVLFLFKKNIRNFVLHFEYKTVSSQPDLSKKFIYLPLHLQPELSTCPTGGAMVNQELVVEMISSILPKDVYLYIKENPKQGYWCRDRKFYKNILKINKSIKFVPLKMSTHTLINNSIAVATVAGTAGWEALFRQKPVLIFGDCFYDSAPGVFKIKSNEDCRLAMDNIFGRQFNYDENKLKLFLQALSDVSISSCSAVPAYFATSALSVEESNKNISLFLEAYIKDNIFKNSN